MRPRDPDRLSLKIVFARALSLGLVGVALTCCMPLEQTAGRTGQILPIPGSERASPEDEQLNARRTFILKYASDLETCERRAQGTAGPRAGGDLNSIRHALAHNPDAQQITVQRGHADAYMDSNEHVKNCLVRLGYVVRE